MLLVLKRLFRLIAFDQRDLRHVVRVGRVFGILERDGEQVVPVPPRDLLKLCLVHDSPRLLWI